MKRIGTKGKMVAVGRKGVWHVRQPPTPTTLKPDKGFMCHVSRVRWQHLPFSRSCCHVGSPSSPSSDHTLCITHCLSHQCTLLSFKWVLSTFTIFKPLM